MIWRDLFIGFSAVSYPQAEPDASVAIRITEGIPNTFHFIGGRVGIELRRLNGKPPEGESE